MFSFNLYFLISAIFLILNALSLFVLYKKGESSHLTFLKFYFILSTLGLILEGLHIAAEQVFWLNFWDQIANITVIFCITFFILFIFSYIGYPNTKLAIIFLISISTIFSILRTTNDWHHLFFATLTPTKSNGFLHYDRVFGQAFTVMVCVYILVLVFTLFRTYQLRYLTHPIFYRQLNLLIYPSVGLLLFVLTKSLNLFPLAPPQITHLTTLPGYLFIINSILHHTLNQQPTSRTGVIEVMKEGILTLNKEGIILDINQHLAKIINKRRGSVTGKPVEAAFPVLYNRMTEIDSTLIQKNNQKSTFRGIHRFLFKYNGRHYDTSWYGEKETCIIILHDVSQLINSIQQTNQLARHDPLTGINNRRHIEESIKKWLHWDHTHDIPYCFILFDIDHFKQFNDQYGHQTGDIVLKSITRIFEGNIRATDMFGRFGGDEFILFLSDISEEQTSQMLERTRQMIEQHPFSTEKGRRFFPTISIGAIFSSSKDILEYDELFQMADEALYQAKENGRNQTCFRRHLFIPGVTDYDESKKVSLY